MPRCTRCGEVRPLDDFSEAQLCGRGKCLQCSNPHLYARRAAAGSGPLAEVGRVRGSPVMPPSDHMRDCNVCGRPTPLSSFSRRQLNGAGKCPACATRSCANNEAQQAADARSERKRARDDALEAFEIDGGSSGDEAYARELLRGIDEMRAAAPSVSNAPPLDARNLGHRMLERLGWAPGEAVGRDAHGVPPSAPLLQHGRRGLGEGAADAPPRANPGSARPVRADELVWTECLERR